MGYRNQIEANLARRKNLENDYNDMEKPALFDGASKKPFDDMWKESRERLFAEMPSANLDVKLLLRVSRLQTEEILHLRGILKNEDGHYNPGILQETEKTFYEQAYDAMPERERAAVFGAEPEKKDGDGNTQTTIFSDNAKPEEPGKGKGKRGRKNKHDDGSCAEGGDVTTKRLGECEASELPEDQIDDPTSTPGTDEKPEPSENESATEDQESTSENIPETTTEDVSSADRSDAASTTSADDATGASESTPGTSTESTKPKNLKVVNK